MTKIQLVERHIIFSKKQGLQVIDELCFKSKNLYNRANYCLRQAYTKTHKIPSEYELTGKLAKRNSLDYKALPAQTSQQIIKLLFKNWKSFFALNKDFYKNPSKYKGKPKLPNYKDKEKGRNILVFTNQQCKIKEGKIHFPKQINLPPLKTKVENLQQVRIVPNTSSYVIEVVYNRTVQTVLTRPDTFLSLDIGLNNLATSFNNTDFKSFIVNGKPLKSINQYYNKELARLKAHFKSNLKGSTSKRVKKLTLKRNNKISDYLHKTSRLIVDYAINNQIETIIIGNNQDWKQNINLGKKNNQNFVQIPFGKLIQQIQYKSLLVGIKTVITEESYTSKTDHLALEPMQHLETRLGKRAERGLFQSSTGRLINADKNGAVGIARKVAGDGFVKNLISRGEVSTPYRISVK
jgi:putative transposase